MSTIAARCDTQTQYGNALRAQVWRGEIAESVHQIMAAACDLQGDLIACFGDATRCVSLRSAAKPLQIAPLVRLSAYAADPLYPEEIAICCASHLGQDMHADLAARVLARSGAGTAMLVCPPKGTPPSPLKHGCSGNHAGLLLQARLSEAPFEGYHLPKHPVQQAVFRLVEELSGEPRIALGLDGCGIPAMGISLAGAARAYARVANSDSEWDPIASAMAHYPRLIGAENWPDVRLMCVTSGRLIAKTGAEGVLCVGNRCLRAGLAVKVLDGSSRPLEAAAVHLLRHLGWISDEEASALTNPPPLYSNTTLQIQAQVAEMTGHRAHLEAV